MNTGTAEPLSFFNNRGWKPFLFQQDTWASYLEGNHGLLNAPTGSGKTYALFFAVLLEFIRDNEDWKTKKDNGLQVLWITPIRALSEEIYQATKRVIDELEISWDIGVRTGDTNTKTRSKQRILLPELLITTPESLHILLAQKDYPSRFGQLKCVVVDEWHELIGSKRGVQMELALSRLKNVSNTRIWGISATIGNLEEATDVLLGCSNQESFDLIKSDIKKEIEVVSVLPSEIEKFPWSGHLGINLLEQVIPLIENSESTLIFTNTRSQTEIWYQRIMDMAPHLAGLVAMHHGSISKEIRIWVENRLHEGKLKAVVCTSSLDLGVDFKPVETIIQIGSPRGVSRFIQRAGRSGHAPGEISKIYFVPTHSMELIEGAALRQAIAENKIEDRIPFANSFDVLIQYLVTLAVSDGFYPDVIYEEVIGTHAYQYMEKFEWDWMLQFITTGGQSLQIYDEYRKVTILEDGLFKVTDKNISSRHRLSIGTIVGDNAFTIKFLNGKRLGTIEEYFIMRLGIGDTFWFAGQSLSLYMIRGNDVFVKKSKTRNNKIPVWQGGRMQMSSMLSDMIRRKLTEAMEGDFTDPELKAITPLLEFQNERSHVPLETELLIEQIKTKEGYHMFVYPFEGRFVHEGLSSLIAYRISLLQPISFSIAFTDYGFELLSNQKIPEDVINKKLFISDNLMEDIQASVNSTEMARRRFRDIASIAGLVFRGYPGKAQKDRHLQANSSILFDVFEDYENSNLLLKQAYQEVFDFQLEEHRLRKVLDRIQNQDIVMTFPEKPTPFCFPIMADRLRDKFTGEEFSEQVKKMTLEFS